MPGKQQLNTIRFVSRTIILATEWKLCVEWQVEREGDQLGACCCCLNMN